MIDDSIVAEELCDSSYYWIWRFFKLNKCIALSYLLITSVVSNQTGRFHPFCGGEEFREH